MVSKNEIDNLRKEIDKLVSDYKTLHAPLRALLESQVCDTSNEKAYAEKQ